MRLFSLPEDLAGVAEGSLQWSPDGGWLDMELMDLHAEGLREGVMLLDPTEGEFHLLTDRWLADIAWCSDSEIVGVADEALISVSVPDGKLREIGVPLEGQLIACQAGE